MNEDLNMLDLWYTPHKNQWATLGYDSYEEVEDLCTYRWERYDYFYNDWDLYIDEDPADDWYLRWMYIKG